RSILEERPGPRANGADWGEQRRDYPSRNPRQVQSAICGEARDRNRAQDERIAEEKTRRDERHRQRRAEEYDGTHDNGESQIASRQLESETSEQTQDGKGASEEKRPRPMFN